MLKLSRRWPLDPRVPKVLVKCHWPPEAPEGAYGHPGVPKSQDVGIHMTRSIMMNSMVYGGYIMIYL